jgi:hypothetical protein
MNVLNAAELELVEMILYCMYFSTIKKGIAIHFFRFINKHSRACNPSTGRQRQEDHK